MIFVRLLPAVVGDEVSLAWASSCVETQADRVLSPSDYVDSAPRSSTVQGRGDFCSAANNGFRTLASDLAESQLSSSYS